MWSTSCPQRRRLMAAGMRYCSTDPEGAEAEGMDVEQMEKLFLSMR